MSLIRTGIRRRPESQLGQFALAKPKKQPAPAKPQGAAT